MPPRSIIPKQEASDGEATTAGQRTKSGKLPITKCPKGRLYLQPAVTRRIPNTKTNATWKTVDRTLQERLRSDAAFAPKGLKLKEKFVERLRDPDAVWAVIESLRPGEQGGCAPCVSKGVDCVVQLEYGQDALRTDSDHRSVIHQCITCELHLNSPVNCELVIGHRPDWSKYTLAVGDDAVEAPLVPEGEGENSSSRPKRSKRKWPLGDESEDMSLTPPPPVQTKKKSRTSTARNDRPGPHPKSPKTARIAQPATSAATRAVVPGVRPEAQIRAMEEIRELVEAVKAQLEKKMAGSFDAMTKSLFTMMQHQLDVLDRVGDSVTPSAETEAEVKRATDYLANFSGSTRRILLMHIEPGGDMEFIVNNMFDVMEMHGQALKRAASDA